MAAREAEEGLLQQGPHPTAPEQGEQRMYSEDSRVQLRITIIRQACGDEAGPRSN